MNPSIRALFAVSLPVLLAAPAAAQNLRLPLQWNREVRSSLRLPDNALDESRVPGQITVITREEIASSGARNLQELFASHPQIVQFDTIGNAHQGTVDLRGFNATPAPATAVIVDGVRVNEADFGQVNFHLIPLENIERVEIYPGPTSRFGKNALAGVIHITTRRGGPNLTAEAATAAGSFNGKKGSLALGGSAGGFDYFVSGVKEQDRGFRQQSGAAIGTVLAKLGYRFKKESDIQISYQRSDDRLEQPGSITGAELAANPEQNVSEVRTISRLDAFTYNQRQALPLGLSLALNGHLRRRREHTPLNRGRSSISESLSAMETKGFAAQLGRESEIFGRRNLTTAGAEFTTSEADSQSSGSFGAFPFASGSIAREHSKGLFVQNVLDIVPETLILTGALRYERSQTYVSDIDTPANNGDQAFHRTSPRIGLNFNPSQRVHTYAVYSESFRTPTVAELTTLGPVQSSGYLRPVIAKNWELGGKVKLSKIVQLRASLYRTSVRNEIYFDPTQGAFGRNINLDKTRRSGVEWGLAAKTKSWDASFSHAYVRAAFESDVTLSDAPWPAQQQATPGDRLPMVAPHRLAGGLTWRPAKSWSLSAQEACVSSRRLVGDESNTESQLPGYCLANLGAAYERSGWRLFIKGSNVLDKRYVSRGIYAKNPASGLKEGFFTPGAGASVSAGVSYRFTAGSGGGLASSKRASVTELARRAVR